MEGAITGMTAEQSENSRVRVGDLGSTIHRSALRDMVIGPNNGINKPVEKGLSLLYDCCCKNRSLWDTALDDGIILPIPTAGHQNSAISVITQLRSQGRIDVVADAVMVVIPSDCCIIFYAQLTSEYHYRILSYLPGKPIS